jgi:hypothetical protein
VCAIGEILVDATTQEQQLNEIKNNLAAVKQRIVDTCQRIGRDPASVRLLPVTKTVPVLKWAKTKFRKHERNLKQ